MRKFSGKIVIIVAIGYLLLLRCSNPKEDSNSPADISDVRTYIKFNQTIEDTLSKYLSDVSDSCDILVMADRSYIHKTLRLNIIPITKTEIKKNYLLYTKINEHTLFINTGIEESLFSPASQGIIDCDSQFFVLYDSMGFISVRERLNDYDDDLRPSHQLDLRLNKID